MTSLSCVKANKEEEKSQKQDDQVSEEPKVVNEETKPKETPDVVNNPSMENEKPSKKIDEVKPESKEENEDEQPKSNDQSDPPEVVVQDPVVEEEKLPELSNEKNEDSKSLNGHNENSEQGKDGLKPIEEPVIEKASITELKGKSYFLCSLLAFLFA